MWSLVCIGSMGRKSGRCWRCCGPQVYRYYGVNKPKFVDALEAGAGVLRRPNALAVNSGSGALITAMTAFGIGPGDEVIVPAFMWVATVAAVVHANAIPVLCEIDESLDMDPADLEKKITARTKLIVPVHMAGSPCNMDAVMAVANRHKIPMLEDVAQSNGGSYHGQKLGSLRCHWASSASKSIRMRRPARAAC